MVSITGPEGCTWPYGHKIFYTICIELLLAPIEWGLLGLLFGLHWIRHLWRPNFVARHNFMVLTCYNFYKTILRRCNKPRLSLTPYDRLITEAPLCL